MLYFSLHSVLASLAVKQYVAGRFPRAVPAYRLLYNGVALVLLMPPPLMLMYSTDSPALWQWRGGWAWAADGVAMLAIAGFFWSLRYYNGQEFLGWRQAQDGDTSRDTHERLTISPLHRYVRHPWYFLALLLLWTRDMNAAFLVTCLAITGYFIVGSRLEENKLVAIYGDAYHQYMARVPGLIPWPSKRLTRDQAAALEQQANGTPPHAGG
ncbi:MAG: hypothetical protein FD165_201 [Gammaproteobacteria bacterium]|nr:MAG: hypothetical protein FD165_201 [Gammaproteobacteria bacterium]TND06779.1 MAG: hypothetical protein FD120_511 [Gammaproteobacteria bacterium]